MTREVFLTPTTTLNVETTSLALTNKRSPKSRKIGDVTSEFFDTVNMAHQSTILAQYVNTLIARKQSEK